MDKDRSLYVTSVYSICTNTQGTDGGTPISVGGRICASYVI